MTAFETPFRLLTLLGLCLLPVPLWALDLEMPAKVAALVARNEPVSTYRLPTGPFAAGQLPVRLVEGVLDQRAYRLDSGQMSLTELASPLKAQLEAQGFRVILDCESRGCGGFDFRFATDVMPEPSMHVDLGEFRFIAAERGAEVVSLLVSRSALAGFVQVTRVGTEALPAADAPVDVPSDPSAPVTVPDAPVDAPPVAPVVPEGPAPAPGDVVAALQRDGHVALDDLVFASGAAVLEDGSYASLSALAEWLKADPARSIVLVGHTDGSGAMEANVSLSKKRAEGVRQVLLMRYGVTAAQVSAAGAGPLSPRASNATEEGRRKNRRVEAVQTSTQ